MSVNPSNLLIAVARNSPDEEELRGLAEKITDWHLLVDLALQHRALSILYANLAGIDQHVPVEVRRRIAREQDRVVMHNLSNAAELIAVLREFEQEQIPAMPFKGVVLAAYAYGDFLHRPGGDLDIAIHSSDLARASEILKRRGYRLRTAVREDGAPAIDGCYEFAFQRPTDGKVLELRWRFDLVWKRYRRDLGIDWVWRNRQTVSVAGSDVPTICPEILLLLLCLHGGKHAWSRLIWVCDVARVLRSCPDINWRTTIAASNRLELGHVLSLGVLLAVRMLGAPIPKDVLSRFEADRTAGRLCGHFQQNMMERPGMTPAGFLPYGMQLLQWRDRLNAVACGRFVQPNERDRALLPLPDRLAWAYYLVRPIRLLLDRSPR